MVKKLPEKLPLVTYLKVQKLHVDPIIRAYILASEELAKRIRAAAPDGSLANKMTLMQLQAQRASINAYIKELERGGLLAAIDEGQRAAIKAASELMSKYDKTLIESIADKQLRDIVTKAEARRAASSLETLLARQASSKLGLSQQVYKTGLATSAQLDNLINKNLAEGSTWGEFAADVKKFINPNTPGGASYAAARLARTEINNAFHSASIERAKAIGFASGMDWHLSGSHPEGDICDDLKDNSPYAFDEVPAKPHPHCFCFVTPNLMTEEEFLTALFDGTLPGFNAA